jgi:hypothetical protein
LNYYFIAATSLSRFQNEIFYKHTHRRMNINYIRTKSMHNSNTAVKTRENKSDIQH